VDLSNVKKRREARGHGGERERLKNVWEELMKGTERERKNEGLEEKEKNK
jgi:hypothetical protein